MGPEALDVRALARAVAEYLAPLLRTDSDRLLDRPSLAERLGVCERSVGSMVSRGELPPPLLHTSGVARWDWNQVLKFLAGRQGKPKRAGRGRYRRTTAES